MVVVHGTKKLRDRLGSIVVHQSEVSTTALGSWYGTVLFWRPQVAMFVNEATLLPVVVPLAPAANLMVRFGPALAAVLAAHGATSDFIQSETAEMRDVRLAKTANRSVIGIMNEFSYLAEVYTRAEPLNLEELSVRLAATPCGPLYRRHGSPDRELAAVLSVKTSP